ncbi:DUF1398 family protein [Aquabacter spiritensis]|uniref:Uncharacterized protein YbcV (DUF1398 family) n=1 Tax=Aquabacter spiritensis TaxID=933073 RepID=A0A4R3M3J7_9HYPH|nr:DUF1398 family protein [Aquabacter spiritensis]TCT07770.1 uncharacterized protein YbcV (DUF1398 family) [Aquabacter spiritensis]
MDDRQIAAARTCPAGAETGAMSFPQIVGTLMETGFEAYAVDFRQARATYYLPDGDTLDLPMQPIEAPVAATFDAARIAAAIKDAQCGVPGYTYRGFCNTVTAAGCTGYLVSFPGRRALYIGRTAETHVERFPD